MPLAPAALRRVLFVICDDLAWGDVSRHGNPYVRTPQLDALAVAGASCTRHLSGPLCTPARAALMTGRHPYRTRAIDTYLGRSILDPDEPTLARLFADAGWRCGLFGKWHLGDTVPSRPHDLGFHETLYHTGGGLRQPANRGNSSYFNATLQHNGTPVETTGYCADVFTDAAIDFMRRAADTPWFCYVAFNTPHTPLEIGDEWVAPLRRDGLPETWAQLYGMVANIDHNVGRLLATLDQLGLADDTLVVFTSDHGPCPSANVEGRIRYNAGLRGHKGTMYEGGLRVPCFARWPRAISAGTMISAPTNPIDFLPTLAAAAGLTPSIDRPPDGVNLLPALTQREPVPARTLCLQWHRGNLPQRHRNATAVTPRWKWYQSAPDAPAELYHLENDPGETTDVADDYPDIVDELGDAYDAWFDAVSRTHAASPAENFAPIRIPVGDPREPAPWLTRQDWRRPDDAPEGWADDQPGDWLLEIKRAGQHRLVVEFAPAKTQRFLIIACGESRFTLSLPPQESRAFLDELTLPAGPCTLAVRLQTNTAATPQGVRFARLSPIKL
ncbi:MAG: arylsulfatase [Opitutaceae bacterium]